MVLLKAKLQVRDFEVKNISLIKRLNCLCNKENNSPNEVDIKVVPVGLTNKISWRTTRGLGFKFCSHQYREGFGLHLRNIQNKKGGYKCNE